MGQTDKPWFQHYERGVPHDIPAPERAIHTLLERTAERYPARAAITFLGASLTFRQLWQDVQRFAAALQAMGVRPGERVSIMLPNCPQFVTAFYGAALAGAVVVNTSPLYVARELEHQLQDSGSETLIMLDAFFPRYQEIAENVPVKRVIVTGIQDALPFPKNVLYPVRERLRGNWVPVRSGGRVFDMKRVMRRTAPRPTPVTVRPDDLALLQYTGGTTGVPKGAMLTHRNLVANCEQARAWLPGLKDGQEVVLAAIPFFHVYGMTTAMNLAMLTGATLVMVPNPRDVKMLLGLVEQYKPTLFPGVPTMYNAINNHPETPKHNLTSIRACISGSAPLPLETARRFREITHGANLVEGYGLTEASPITHANPVFGEQIEGSIGVPFPSVDALIVNEQGQPVPTGEVGELWVAGPNIMRGYWQRPDESAKVLFEREGRTWLATGDMATMDDGGYFRIVDRKKDLIIAGGYNIYPREVEEVLYQHPAILEAAAVGAPDPHRGETVRAYVVFKPGMSVTWDELNTFCRERLSPYKVPRQFERRDELPKTAVGKVLRRQLAEEARTPSSRSA
ncbi:long-chain-fatty-acid--CoA ligase [Deinococcus maricopensis]|uniref:Long-chain-fatty-acid--CoA ligase n=1 Tax=Deinococcus maricopensis (strain DSM 21211 / LMG 22137 / NRRL B-23946 / LB-34) TaxID=709986 RepID=E8U6N0_DEIML|nr:long-chain fatty acid--CoA ligase [Deinococcus maricopensis]ADV66719.1 Long-chain-fatty-acid--CoA ligase [Deinococcus maricopensis DSM 21211]